MIHDFATGQRVYWVYRHHLGAGATTNIRKEGRFIRELAHGRTYRGYQMALVQFDGNKHPSKVPLLELRAQTT